MNDTLNQVESAIENYSIAMNRKNGRSVYSNMLHIEQHSVFWLSELAAECEAYRKFAMTADTLGVLAALHPDNPLEFVYICSPYRGDRRANLAAARKYCLQAIEEGYIPIAPHLMFAGIIDDDDPAQRAVGLKIGLEAMRICREVRVYGHLISAGMSGEIKQADVLKIPVRRMDQDD